MAFRKKMSKSQSKRNFRSGRKVKGRNFATAQRGGYRI